MVQSMLSFDVQNSPKGLNNSRFFFPSDRVLIGLKDMGSLAYFFDDSSPDIFAQIWEQGIAEYILYLIELNDDFDIDPTTFAWVDYVSQKVVSD